MIKSWWSAKEGKEKRVCEEWLKELEKKGGAFIGRFGREIRGRIWVVSNILSISYVLELAEDFIRFQSSNIQKEHRLSFVKQEIKRF